MDEESQFIDNTRRSLAGRLYFKNNSVTNINTNETLLRVCYKNTRKKLHPITIHPFIM